MTRYQQLRTKAAEVLRAGRKDATLRNQSMSTLFLALAGSYKRLAALDLELRAFASDLSRDLLSRAGRPAAKF